MYPSCPIVFNFFARQWCCHALFRNNFTNKQYVMTKRNLARSDLNTGVGGMSSVTTGPRGYFYITTPFYYYRDSHYKDKTVWRPSYLCNGNPVLEKDGIHYSDVIMGIMASQITSLKIVYSSIYSGADQRKHQSSASLAFVRGIHGWHKWPVMRKMFPFDDVIM